MLVASTILMEKNCKAFLYSDQFHVLIVFLVCVCVYVCFSISTSPCPPSSWLSYTVRMTVRWTPPRCSRALTISTIKMHSYTSLRKLGRTSSRPTQSFQGRVFKKVNKKKAAKVLAAEN